VSSPTFRVKDDAGVFVRKIASNGSPWVVCPVKVMTVAAVADVPPRHASITAPATAVAFEPNHSPIAIPNLL